jgi:hypothetical protein
LYELVWWVITGVIIFGLLWPLESAGVPPYHRFENIFFTAILITFTRYIFQLQYTWLARLQWVKAIIMIAMIPLLFVLINYFNGFMNFIEERTFDPLTGHLPVSERRGLDSYIWSEMLFVGAGSIIASIVFAFRLFSSIWRQHNA